MSHGVALQRHGEWRTTITVDFDKLSKVRKNRSADPSGNASCNFNKNADERRRTDYKIYRGL
jgi:hypothetical protein